jgi:2-keto-4-pentenoate hydratase/2-oxohepta-3-ene-1,7-dioic acid hydratase in catechol pathway
VKIVTFRGQALGARVGALLDDQVIDLNLADRRLPSNLLSLIEGGQPALDLVRALVDDVGAVAESARVGLDAVTLTAPWPGKRIAMAGANFAGHILEAISKDPQVWSDWLAGPGEAAAAPASIEAVRERLRADEPWGFWKNLVCVTNPGAAVPYPRRTRHLDYEAEVGIVIAKPAKDIRADDIADYVWGVTLMNDWSDRDAFGAGRSLSYNLAKNFDGSLTIGPCIVVDELDPQDIEVMTRVNGEVRQHFSTSDMVFSFGECVEHLSRDLTFVAGDMLGGGTDAGTAADIVGHANMNRPEAARWFLRPGDTVEISSPQIGAFTNAVTDPVRVSENPQHAEKEG